MERTRYSTDLTDKQWEVFAVFFIVFSSKVGRPPKYCLREIINAIFYLVHTGCQWRELPHDFPPWPTVYYHFRKYDLNWASIHRSLHADLREKSGRKPEPTAAIIDSQSVKTSSMADSRGIDGNKKIKGRKRHVVVDTLGFPLIVIKYMMQTCLTPNKPLALLKKCSFGSQILKQFGWMQLTKVYFQFF